MITFNMFPISHTELVIQIIFRVTYTIIKLLSPKTKKKNSKLNKHTHTHILLSEQITFNHKETLKDEK